MIGKGSRLELEAALELNPLHNRSINSMGNILSLMGQLGQIENARKALSACEDKTTLFYWAPNYSKAADTEHFEDGLRKAGWQD